MSVSPAPHEFQSYGMDAIQPMFASTLHAEYEKLMYSGSLHIVLHLEYSSILHCSRAVLIIISVSAISAYQHFFPISAYPFTQVSNQIGNDQYQHIDISAYQRIRILTK